MSEQSEGGGGNDPPPNNHARPCKPFTDGLYVLKSEGFNTKQAAELDVPRVKGALNGWKARIKVGRDHGIWGVYIKYL